MTACRRKPRQPKNEPGDICTWVCPCGTVQSQIDYIAVSQKYRNFARRGHVIQARRGNLEQRQRAEVKLEIYRHVQTQYFATPKKDARNEALYNLKHIREEPTLLEQHCEENQIGIKFPPSLGVARNWESMGGGGNIARLTNAYIRSTAK